LPRPATTCDRTAGGGDDAEAANQVAGQASAQSCPPDRVPQPPAGNTIPAHGHAGRDSVVL